MTDITIPPDAIDAALRKWLSHSGTRDERMEAACLAMLRAWQTDKHKMIVGVALDEVGGQYPAIILPLTEPNNDK
jgi:hypothetical protein